MTERKTRMGEIEVNRIFEQDSPDDEQQIVTLDTWTGDTHSVTSTTARTHYQDIAKDIESLSGSLLA